MKRPKSFWMQALNGLMIGGLLTGTTTHPLLAATYYVAAGSGSDSNDAAQALDPATPWQTLTRALEDGNLASGDVIQLAEGTYDAANGESFPLPLADGVAILGSGRDTTSVVGPEGWDAVFSADMAVVPSGSGYYLADLGISGEGDGVDTGVDIHYADGELALIIEGVSFSKTAIGVSVKHADGIGTMDVQLTGNSFTDISSRGVYLNVSGASAAHQSLLLDGNTFSQVNTALAMSANYVYGEHTISFMAANNAVDDASDGFNVYAYRVEGNQATDVTLSGNSFTNLGGTAFSQSVSSLSHSFGQTVDQSLVATENTFENIDRSAMTLSARYLQNSRLRFDYAIDGNVFTNTGEQTIGVIVSDLTNGDTSGVLQITDNVQTNGGYFPLFYLNDLAYGTLATDITIDGNTATGSNQDTHFMWLDYIASMAEMDLQLNLQNNEISGTAGSGLVTKAENLSYNENTTLDVAFNGNTVSGTEGNGIYLNMTSFNLNPQMNVTLQAQNNTFSDIGNHAIYSYQYGHDQNDELNFHTTVSGNSISGTGSMGIFIDYTSMNSNGLLTFDTRILENNLETTGRQGINYTQEYTEEGLEMYADLMIAGNTITGTGSRGISVSMSELSSMSMIGLDIGIFNNTVTDAGGTGITFDVSYADNNDAGWGHVSIAGNTITNAEGLGIRVDQSSWSDSKVDQMILVAGNTVTGALLDGISINLSDQSSLTGNDIRVQDNVLEDNGGTGAYIETYDYQEGAHILLSGNTIRNNASYGLYLSGFSAFYGQNNKPTETGIVGNVSPFDMGGGPLGSVGGNVLEGNGEYALYARTGSTADLFAQTNYWGTTDVNVIAGQVYDAADEDALSAVSVEPTLMAAPNTAATASLSYEVVDDGGLEGPSPGDVLRFTASLTGTTKRGCGSLILTSGMPNNATYVDGSAATERGTFSYAGNDGVMAYLGSVAGGETVSASWDVVIGVDASCPDLETQATFTCRELGDLPTDDPNQSGESDITVVSQSTTFYYMDGDSDGYGDPNTAVESCFATLPLYHVSNALDCNDSDDTINPEGTEVCDSIDNNCDGTVDEDEAVDASSWPIDQDGDGYGSDSAYTNACDTPVGYADNTDDCYDSRDDINPAAIEICDGEDNNCDGEIDEGVKTAWFLDADGDGHGDEAVSVEACRAPSGFVSSSDDCDDNQATVYPQADEICDTLDNDCDTLTDEEGSSLLYIDADEDSYGDPASATVGCTTDGLIVQAGDCDDSDAAVNPDSTEICDGIDNNCDGDVDESLESVFFADTDDDGYGDVGLTIIACTAPSGYVSNGNDCDDSSSDVNPLADEVCDGLDNDCNGETDEGLESVYFVDGDGDGYGDATDVVVTCEAPASYTLTAGDCNDGDSEINPDAVEVCDGLDNDCNGEVDEVDGCETGDNGPVVDGGGGGGCNSTGGRGDGGALALWAVSLFLMRRRLRRKK